MAPTFIRALSVAPRVPAHEMIRGRSSAFFGTALTRGQVHLRACSSSLTTASVQPYAVAGCVPATGLRLMRANLRRLVVGAVSPHRVENACEPSGQRDDRDLFSASAFNRLFPAPHQNCNALGVRFSRIEMSAAT